MSLPSAESFLLNLASIDVLRLMDLHRENQENEYKAVLHLVHKIIVFSPKRNDSNGPINMPARATTPVVLAEGGVFRLTNVLIGQGCNPFSFVIHFRHFLVNSDVKWQSRICACIMNDCDKKDLVQSNFQLKKKFKRQGYVSLEILTALVSLLVQQ
jgi:hypothetical protein